MSKPKKTRARRCWTTAVTGVASVAVASAYGAHLLPLDEPRTMSYDVMETAAIVESPNTIGMSEGADLYWTAANPLTQLQLDETLDQMQALGVETVRVGIPWGLVDAGLIPGQYNWAVVDRIIQEAAVERGMGVLGVITGSPLRYGLLPPFAAHPTDSAEFAAYLDAFSDFSSAVANRYKGKVSAYEIWNEPNYFQFWNPVDAAAYTRLLQAGYTAIKDPQTGDPSALVIGGVVGATQTTPFTLDPVTFVQQMYAAGAHGYFDALSFHPYGNLPFTDRDVNTVLRTPIEQLEAIRAVMDANGDPSLKIWISEYGVSTEGWVTEEEKDAAYQKQYEYLENILTNWKKVNGAGPIFIYTTRDQLTGAPGTELNFGIFETDWDAKPAAELIENIIACGMTQCPPDIPPPPPAAAAAAAAVNPLAAFFAQLSLGFSQFFGSIFAPNLFSQMFSSIGNFFASIFSPPPATVAAAAPPNENFAPLADESDTGDASRSVDPDPAAASLDGGDVDDELDEGNNLVEGDALPAGEELNPTVANVEPVVEKVVVEKTVEADVDPDLESSKLANGDDGKAADELKTEGLKDDELKTDDDIKADDEVKTADDKPANDTAANGTGTSTKANAGAACNDNPDADNAGDAGSEGGDES
jgi:hypothetical protein